MTTLYVGWDVGAWNCDKNKKSRDTLVVLEVEGGDPVLKGRPWRGNLREELTRDISLSWAGGKCDVDSSSARLVIAIDTPLGWPADFLATVAGSSERTPVDSRPRFNQQIFRLCESHLPDGFNALSAVRDQIGSQSSKGIYFLSTRGFNLRSAGVWERGLDIAIEAYPTPTSTSATAVGFVNALITKGLDQKYVGKSQAASKDVRDALFCAVVAMMFDLSPNEFRGVPKELDAARVQREGWIWLPNDVDAKLLPKSGKATKREPVK